MFGEKPETTAPAPRRGRSRLLSLSASVCALSVLLVLFALGDIYVSPQNDRVNRYGGTGTSRSAYGQPFATFDEPPVQSIVVQAIARRTTTSSTTTSTTPTTVPGAPTTARARNASPNTQPRMVTVTSPTLGSSTTTTMPRPAIPPLPPLPPLPSLPVLPVLPSLPTNNNNVAPVTIPTTTSTTTIPPAPVTLDATLSLSISAIPVDPYDINSDAAPRLSWSTVDATQVSVSGLGVVSLDLSGEVTLCPGVVADGICTPMAGSYDYDLSAHDDLGHTVTRTVTLVVG